MCVKGLEETDQAAAINKSDLQLSPIQLFVVWHTILECLIDLVKVRFTTWLTKSRSSVALC